MSFTVRRNFGDGRQLGRYARPLMTLMERVAAEDWERVIEAADEIATEARVELVLAASAEFGVRN